MRYGRKPARKRSQPGSPVAPLFESARRAAGGGDFAKALRLVAQVRQLKPAHYEAARLESAILARQGQPDRAHRVMVEFFQRHPMRTIGKEAAGDSPATLRVRGFHRTRLILKRKPDGLASTTFRGGHFTTDFLLLEPPKPVFAFTVAGEGEIDAGMLPDYRLLLNTIAEPDIEDASLKKLARHLERHPAPAIINRPELVLEMSRDRNYRRLRGQKGLRFPETHRMDFVEAGAADIRAAMDRHDLTDGPVILRQCGTHTARSVGLIRDDGDLDDYLAGGRISGEYYLIRYHQALWRGEFFRKLRLFFIDGAFYPVVCHLDRVWNVHGGNRKDVMKGDPALMAEEKSFLADWRGYVGTANAERLEAVAEMVGLDFFGIDFTVDERGEVLIYEMNPAMRHSFDHGQVFRYKLPYDHAISDAFAAMVERRLAA